MFCPKCRCEFAAGVAACGECGSDLVAAPGDMPFADDSRRHVDRARDRGVAALLVRSEDDFLPELSAWTGS
ncbi:MAG: hypothetical protein ACM3NF_08450 [Gemmatimonadota bacterium]